VILGQPVLPGFLEIEGTRGERYRNQWSPRHDPHSVDKVASKWNSACKGSECRGKRVSTDLESRSPAH
jgi:hypothetical protein